MSSLRSGRDDIFLALHGCLRRCLKALTVRAGRHGGVFFVRTHLYRLQRAVVLRLVMVFTCCHITRDTVVYITGVHHNHLFVGSMRRVKKNIRHYFIFL